MCEDFHFLECRFGKNPFLVFFLLRKSSISTWSGSAQLSSSYRVVRVPAASYRFRQKMGKRFLSLYFFLSLFFVFLFHPRRKVCLFQFRTRFFSTPLLDESGGQKREREEKSPFLLSLLSVQVQEKETNELIWQKSLHLQGNFNNGLKCLKVFFSSFSLSLQRRKAFVAITRRKRDEYRPRLRQRRRLSPEERRLSNLGFFLSLSLKWKGCWKGVAVWVENRMRRFKA